MKDSTSTVNRLIELACEDHPTARQELLEYHRDRLRRMIAQRLDARLAARLDPSDVVQVTFLEAYQRLPNYLQTKSLPFYVWLRQIAMDTMIDLHRRHVSAQKRSVSREDMRGWWLLSPGSTEHLCAQLVAADPGPLQQLELSELKTRLRQALEDLPQGHREVLIMLYVEQLSTLEIAAVLGVGIRTVQIRHGQALESLHRKLGDGD